MNDEINNSRSDFSYVISLLLKNIIYAELFYDGNQAFKSFIETMK